MSQLPDDDVEGERPGRTRTWWHPLLARMLGWVLSDAYDVDDEVPVGRMPLRLDVVLVRRRGGELTAAARRKFPSLAPRLNQLTLIEFKSATDALESGDLDHFFALAHLLRGQQRPIPRRTDLTLVILAPQLTAGLREDVERSGLELRESEPGVLLLEGAFFTTWIVEMDRVAGLNEPILTLFSRVFLRDRRHIIDEWKHGGYDDVLCYVMQQIQQFQHGGEAFVVHHQGSEIMMQTLEELRAAVIAELPVEDRLRGISVDDIYRVLSEEDRKRILEMKTAVTGELPAEDRLRGLSMEDRLRGASVGEIFTALSAEDRQWLLELAKHQSSQPEKP